MHYTDGTIINGISDNIYDLPRRDAKDHMLDTDKITNVNEFLQLFRLWIYPVISQWVLIGQTEDEVWQLFSPRTPSEEPSEQECEDFIATCRKLLCRSYCLLCPKELFESIVENIVNNMGNAPTSMRLRLFIVCVQTNRLPESIFGQSCYDAFDPSRKQCIIRHDLDEGESFTLDFAKVGNKLYPITIQNTSDQLRTMLVQWNETQFSVRLPPHGFLRALASTKSGNTLLGIKGNISFNSATSAVVQLTDGGDKTVQMVSGGMSPITVPTGEYFCDAAANGEGGCTYIKHHNIFSTTKGTLATRQKPIGCYGAGNKNWAWLFEDGQIRSSFKGREGAKDIISMVENGPWSILTLTRDGATWECRHIGCISISLETYVNKMMERFSNQKYCEYIDTGQMRIFIDNNGKFGVE